MLSGKKLSNKIKKSELKLEKLNSGSKLKWFLCVLFMVVGLLLVIDIATTRAKYKVTQSIKLAEGKISYKPYDFKIMAMYQENDSGVYEEIDRMPSSGYVINEDKSYCTLDNVNKDTNAKLFTNSNGGHEISNLAYNDKCYIWFNKTAVAKDTILAEKTVDERTNFNQLLSADTTGIIYKTLDDDGDSFYYAGNPTDNWVKFAGFYWRIVRINGDGTIRLIYNGLETETTGLETQLAKTSAFNNSYINNTYVGYMYTSGQVHGLGSSSTIKSELENWYNTYIVNSDEVDKIDINAGFCGDREPSTIEQSSNGAGGIGTTTTYYGAHIRLFSNKKPSLKCLNKNDLYTSTVSSKGNRMLSYPIGLITADEISYAGGVYGTNNAGYYLYTNQVYWSITPDNFFGGLANIFIIDDKGAFGGHTVNNSRGIRPVINLKATVQFKEGTTGTAENPYVVVGAE